VRERLDFAEENIPIAIKGFNNQSSNYKTYTHFSNQQKKLKHTNKTTIFLSLQNA
jgi:hypothetical protein